MDSPKIGKVKITMGDITGQQEFYIEESLSIGRDAKNDIVVPSLNVSRNHARIEKGEDGQYRIMDLGSHNGTLLNGRLATKDILQDNDVIGIADIELTFNFTTEAVDNQDKPNVSNEDIGQLACNSTTFIDLSELKKEEMESLRKEKPSVTNKWTED